MAEYDNTNRGAIWKNDKKETEKHPDFRGEMEVTAPGKYWVSAWKRSPGAPDNAPALSFALTPKDSVVKSEPAPKQQTDDDFPF